MTCQTCGAHCQGRFCRDCELERLHGDGTTGGTADTQPDKQLYRCTECGNEYENEGLGQCPECEGHRARFIGGTSA